MSVLRRTPYRVAIIMEKKIIACSLIMLLLVTCFVACGKKPTIKGKNGMEYVVVTDEEGSSVLNADGDIAIYVTDDRGRYVKDGNGERQTNYIEFPDKIINGSTYESADFIFTVSEDAGWTLEQNGKFTKGDDENTYITVKDLGEAGEEEALSTLIERIKSENEGYLEEIKKQYPDAVMNVTDVEITDKKVPATVMEFIIKDANGTFFHHAYDTYYICNGHYYVVEYVCANPANDVPAADVLAMVNAGLTVKDRTP